jgi:hypothetical protein
MGDFRIPQTLGYSILHPGGRRSRLGLYFNGLGTSVEDVARIDESVHGAQTYQYLGQHLHSHGFHTTWLKSGLGAVVQNASAA